MIFDDHDIVRMGLRTFIDAEDDLDVVGGASSAGEECRPPPSASPTP